MLDKINELVEILREDNPSLANRFKEEIEFIARRLCFCEDGIDSMSSRLADLYEYYGEGGTRDTALNDGAELTCDRFIKIIDGEIKPPFTFTGKKMNLTANKIYQLMNRGWKHAALDSLIERWYPIQKATSLKEMNKIVASTSCALCVEAARISDEDRKLDQSMTHSSCDKCPLSKWRTDDSQNKHDCTVAYFEFDACLDGDFDGALSAANKVVKQLEEIAEISHEV